MGLSDYGVSSPEMGVVVGMIIVLLIVLILYYVGYVALVSDEGMATITSLNKDYM